MTSLNKSDRKNEIKLLMELLDIDKSLLNTKVKYLSGGEMRRISLLRALCIKPKYLFLDEILSGLDLFQLKM